VKFECQAPLHELNVPPYKPTAPIDDFLATVLNHSKAGVPKLTLVMYPFSILVDVHVPLELLMT